MDRVFSFLLWPKRRARGPWKHGRKKRGSITCCTDRVNEANKMFIIWLCWLFRFCKGDRELEVRTATYGPGIDQSQHAKSVSHITKYNTALYLRAWGLSYGNTEDMGPFPALVSVQSWGARSWAWCRQLAPIPLWDGERPQCSGHRWHSSRDGKPLWGEKSHTNAINLSFL